MGDDSLDDEDLLDPNLQIISYDLDKTQESEEEESASSNVDDDVFTMRRDFAEGGLTPPAFYIIKTELSSNVRTPQGSCSRSTMRCTTRSISTRRSSELMINNSFQPIACHLEHDIFGAMDDSKGGDFAFY